MTRFQDVPKKDRPKIAAYTAFHESRSKQRYERKSTDADLWFITMISGFVGFMIAIAMS